MAEYIDKGLALATACSGLTREIEGERWIRVDEVRASLKAAPTIEAEPKRGRWIYDGKGGYGLYKCSECNEFWSHWYADVIPIERMNKILKFCPNCGAKMDEVEE